MSLTLRSGLGRHYQYFFGGKPAECCPHHDGCFVGTALRNVPLGCVRTYVSAYVCQRFFTLVFGNKVCPPKRVHILFLLLIHRLNDAPSSTRNMLI